MLPRVRLMRFLVLAVALALVFATPAHAGTGGAWRRTRPMHDERAGHTATVLPDGRVLVTGGSTCGAVLIDGTAKGCPVSSAELYDPGSSSWSPAAPMLAARLGHTATLLDNGSVLVVGGVTDDALTPSDPEVYDPVTGMWSPTGPMQVSRVGHSATVFVPPPPFTDRGVLVAGGSTRWKIAEAYDPASNAWYYAGTMSELVTGGSTATLLEDGRVLVAGGVLTSGALADRAETYDPTSGPPGTWPYQTMDAPHAYHTATLLPDGDVLIVGGGGAGSVEDGDVTGGGSAGATLYDPATSLWRSIVPMSTPRVDHTATLLDSGQVLVTGGSDDASAELYDPGLGGWILVPSMNVARRGHAAASLPGGQILVSGGTGPPSLSTAELYDPTAHQWARAPPMSVPCMFHAAALLDSGKVLVTGGLETSGPVTALPTAQVYDLTANTWTSTASGMSFARASHTETRLQNGTVLVAGGNAALGIPTATSEVYDPGAGTWTTAWMSVTRAHHTATLLDSGQVLVAGGTTDGVVAIGSAEIYQPGPRSWTPAGQMSVSRQHHTATLLQDGRVLCTGGEDADVALASAELYDPTTREWETPPASMSTARTNHTATLLQDGAVLVAGGNDSDGVVTALAEVYSPVTGTWASAGSMTTARAYHVATLLGSGRVLVAGGSRDGSAEVYEPGVGWTRVASTSVAHTYAAAVLLDGARVLITGGIAPPPDQDDTIATAEVYGPEPAGDVCAAGFECASGVCLGGVCCAGACGEGSCASCSIADGAPEDGACTLLLSCGAFACDTQASSLACLASCTTSADCAPGFVCDASHDCVAPRNTYVDDACALSRAGGLRPAPGRPFEPAALFLAALAALRRRVTARRTCRVAA
jgi:hypothetical protein